MTLFSQSEDTFKQKRQCLFCTAPIPDQSHRSLKFCRRQKLADGSVRSCKDDFHSLKRKTTNAPFKRIADFHRQMSLRIQDLYKRSKGIITIDQLNQWGILLSRPVEFSMEGGLFKFYFINYLIKQISKTEYNISEHGKQF